MRLRGSAGVVVLVFVRQMDIDIRTSHSILSNGHGCDTYLSTTRTHGTTRSVTSVVSSRTAVNPRYRHTILCRSLFANQCDNESHVLVASLTDLFASLRHAAGSVSPSPCYSDDAANAATTAVLKARRAARIASEFASLTG